MLYMKKRRGEKREGGRAGEGGRDREAREWQQKQRLL
jgi:hypothetical protein